MHTMMKRILQAIENIPLHLTLGIVRLDDGLGESWALPFQACRTFLVCNQHFASEGEELTDTAKGFHDVLQTVVFGNNRPGATRTKTGQYLLRSAQSGSRLLKEHWDLQVKEGAHIIQAMIIPHKRDITSCTNRTCQSRLNIRPNIWYVD